MPMSRFLITASTTIFALCSLTSFAEEVEHPVYKSWASHPVGTSITLKSVTTSGNKKIVTTNKTTLVELTPDKATLEVIMVSDGTGQVVESPPQTYTQRRMFPLFGDVKKEDVGKPPKGSKQGEETLKVLGKEYQTQWFDAKGRTDAGETFTRTWMSDKIPGKLIKAVTKVPAADNQTSVELIELKIPGKVE
jgi:hypothetical protein